MSIPALSTAAFTQYVNSSSNISASQQAFQSLQQGLASGNLAAAQLAFQTYQSLNQNLTKAGGAGQSAQLAADLTTLGSALSNGNLSASRTAFAAVQSDLKSTTSQAITAAETAAAQTVNEIEELLSTFNANGSSSSSSSSANSVLSLLNSGSSPNSASSIGDQTTQILQGHYSAAANNLPAAPPAASNSGVSVYA